MRYILSIPLFFCLSSFSQTQTSITFDSTYAFTQVHVPHCVQNYDGGYLIAGGAGGSEGSHSYILQTNSSGHVVKKIDYLNSYLNSAKWVSETADGGFISAGEEADAEPTALYFRKYTASGDLQWTSRMCPTPRNRVFSIIQTSDGGYAAIGVHATINNVGWRSWLMKLDQNGDSLWARELAPTVSVQESGEIRELQNGNLLVSCMRSNGDLRLVETTSDGNDPLAYDFSGYLSASGGSFEVLNNNRLVVAGYQSTNVVVRILDASRSTEDQYSFSPPNNASLVAVSSIALAADSGYIIVSSVYTTANHTDSWVLRLNKQGAIIWQKTIEQPNTNGYSDDYAVDIKYCKDDQGFVLLGYCNVLDTIHGNMANNIFLEKMDSMGNLATVHQTISLENSLSIYPNPSFNGKVNLKFDFAKDDDVYVEIFTSDGKRIYSNTVFCAANTYTELPIDLNDISSNGGLYILRVRASGQILQKKLMVIKP